MRRIPKRPRPDQSVLEWREGALFALQFLSPCRPNASETIAFGPGNRKTGTTGSIYRTILLWNLPAIATCPGASGWCRRHCYNADTRSDVFPHHLWAHNWWQAVQRPRVLFSALAAQLKRRPRPIGVRLHSSGDFFSKDYIRLWSRFARAHPDVFFWSYTRSWKIPELIPDLERLRALANFTLFASWDSSMPPPPNGWRRSLVFDTVDELSNFTPDNPSAKICPEQFNLTQCASCSICSNPDDTDVLFLLH